MQPDVFPLDGYAAFKLQSFCEVCFPAGPPETGKRPLATFQWKDAQGNWHPVCADHVPKDV